MYEEGGYHHHQGHEGGPEGQHVQHREGHVLRADLDGQEVVAEAALGRRGQHEEDHDGAVHGHQRKIQLRRHDAALRRRGPQGGEPAYLGIRVDQVIAHEQRQAHADQHRKQGQEVVLDADDLVVQAEDILPDEALRRVMRVDYG